MVEGQLMGRKGNFKQQKKGGPKFLRNMARTDNRLQPPGIDVPTAEMPDTVAG